MKLWHCVGARSLRALWALEELGLDYELVVLPFPPRVLERDFLKVNTLGTVPYFEHETASGTLTMTESCAIPQYVATVSEDEHFMLPATHPEYGSLLNWCYHADATLTFPQTIFLRYSALEPDPAKQQVGDDYAKWFVARLRRLDAHLLEKDYLVAGRFTIADICIAYALWLGRELKLSDRYQPQTLAYLERVTSRDGFKRADALGRDDSGSDSTVAS
ncbi:MAG: glutathione S-transferase family protein [Pseudomonadota bacterium]